MEAAKDNSVRDAARRAVERIDENDIGIVLVVIDGAGLPTTYPVGLNMPGRLKALAAAVQTLAKETPSAVAVTLDAAASQIGSAANKLMPELTPSPAPAPAEIWKRVAAEGETCAVPAGSTVRYGVEGQYAMKVVNGLFVCGNELFGDPAVGVVKACELLIK